MSHGIHFPTQSHPPHSFPPEKAPPKEASKKGESSKQNNISDAAQAIIHSFDSSPVNPSENTQAPPASLASFGQEFVGVLETLLKEGYASSQTSSAPGSYGFELEQTSQALFKGEKTDIQNLREFVREAKYLLGSQALEISQILQRLQLEQGGALWKKVQQILQKASAQNGQEQASEMALQEKALSSGLSDSVGKGTLQKEISPEKNQAASGAALFEILKGEMNPQNLTSHLLIAFQILDREGLRRSSEKLLSYLKQRTDLTDREILEYLNAMGLSSQLASHPKEAIPRSGFGYSFISFLVLLIFFLLIGIDEGYAIAASLGIAGLIYLITQLLGPNDK